MPPPLGLPRLHRTPAAEYALALCQQSKLLDDRPHAATDRLERLPEALSVRIVIVDIEFLIERSYPGIFSGFLEAIVQLLDDRGIHPLRTGKSHRYADVERKSQLGDRRHIWKAGMPLVGEHG